MVINIIELQSLETRSAWRHIPSLFCNCCQVTWPIVCWVSSAIVDLLKSEQRSVTKFLSKEVNTPKVTEHQLNGSFINFHCGQKDKIQTFSQQSGTTAQNLREVILKNNRTLVCSTVLHHIQVDNFLSIPHKKETIWK